MPPKGQDNQAIALVGYRQLADQLRHEEVLSWKRLETYLVISSALVALIGLFWPKPDTTTSAMPLEGSRILLVLLISAVGLLLSLGWIVVVRRSEAFHDFRYLQLIDAEATSLKPITTFSKADEYFSGHTVSIQGEPRRLSGLARWARIYQLMSAVPFVFSLLWATLLAYFIITVV